MGREKMSRINYLISGARQALPRAFLFFSTYKEDGRLGFQTSHDNRLELLNIVKIVCRNGDSARMAAANMGFVFTNSGEL
jgi:hypothetical protein